MATDIEASRLEWQASPWNGAETRAPVLRTTHATSPIHDLPDHIQHDARGMRMRPGGARLRLP